MLVGDVDAHDSCHDNSSDTQVYLDRCAGIFWTALIVIVIITVAVSSTV
jgi:hypothetical protein